ncbi:MAG: hypothetical protein IT204_02575 [Fimbriimonadaceae bacterium]|nr:hypothetical protein [Fimbriimonadaceae bacterium]
MARRWVVVWTLMCCLSAASRGSGPDSGPGRIALGGLFPMGYVGCLTRHGLPRDVLYDAQLRDLATLQRYDLVILAGSLADPATDRSLQEYLRQGGHAIVDYSGSAANLPNLPNRGELATWMAGKSTAPGGFGVAGVAVAPWSPAASSGPLAGIPLAAGLVDPKSLGYLPDAGALTEVRVLARYPATVRAAGNTAEAQGGPAAPAIVAGRLGRGRVILCGLQVGVKTEHTGLDLEALILAMLKEVTSGRAEPQLRPDTPHVGYAATVGSVVAEVAVAAEDPTAVEDQPPAPPGVAAPLPRGWRPIEPEPAAEWDLVMTVPSAATTMLVRYWNGESFARLRVGPTGLRLSVRRNGREEVVAERAVRLQPGSPLTLKERCDRLLAQAGQIALVADLTTLPPGVLAVQGSLAAAEYRPAESVYFSDDFMRTDAATGPWRWSGGDWSTAPDQNAEMGANPFALKCRAGDGTATALAGDETWDEYRVTCAVRPTSAAGGTVGLGWYAQDERNMYLLQANLTAAGQTAPDGWQLVRLQDGRAHRLAACPGGVQRGQWYALRVSSSGPRLSVEVDGVPLLTAVDATFSRGAIALQVGRAEARFDDVHATASVWPAPQGAVLAGRPPHHAGLIDVDSWASPATGWEPDPAAAGQFWRREVFFGDTDLDFRWAAIPDGGEVELRLRAETAAPADRYSLRLRRLGPAGELVLSQAGKLLGSRTVPLPTGVHLALQRRGPQLTALVGGQPVLATATPALPMALRLGFATRGFRPQISALTVWSRQLADLTFDAAPTDWWVTSGTWDLTNRWSCVPEWSWFGGYSEQVAAAWLKPEFAGDLVLDAYVGAKMLDNKVPGYRGPAQERTGDFNLTICGDGRNVESGYTWLVGPSGSPREIVSTHGRISGADARLLRNGVAVARNDDFRLFSQGHNRWANLRVARRGGQITLWVDGQEVLTYRDPQPLPSGYAAVWTRGNGILVPRVTVAYQQRTARVLSLPPAAAPP